MVDPIEAELDRAEAEGRVVVETEPRAIAARFDPATKRVLVDLANGCSYAVPADLIQELKGASAEDLAAIEVDGAGFNLHFPALDADLFVPALVAGLFGTSEWMKRALARQAGRAKSPAKSAAARANGAKGGRPRKIAQA